MRTIDTQHPRTVQIFPHAVDGAELVVNIVVDDFESDGCGITNIRWRRHGPVLTDDAYCDPVPSGHIAETDDELEAMIAEELAHVIAREEDAS